MPTKQQKAAGRHGGVELNRRNWAIVDEFVAADYVSHTSAGAELRGRETSRLFIAEFGATFPDFHLATEDVVVAHRLKAMSYLFGL